MPHAGHSMRLSNAFSTPSRFPRTPQWHLCLHPKTTMPYLRFIAPCWSTHWLPTLPSSPFFIGSPNTFVTPRQMIACVSNSYCRTTTFQQSSVRGATWVDVATRKDIEAKAACVGQRKVRNARFRGVRSKYRVAGRTDCNFGVCVHVGNAEGWRKSTHYVQVEAMGKGSLLQIASSLRLE